MSKQQYYTSFLEFGKGINDQVESPLNPANPLTYCMFPTVGSQFTHGSASSGLLYDTNNVNCMSFMAERCRSEWDGFCDGYVDLNVDTYWPNVAVIDTSAFELAQFFLKKKNTVGENLIRNTVQRRFISYPNQSPTYQPFDYNTANSPMIAVYANNVNSYSVLQNLDHPDSDLHVLKMMQYPQACFDVLARIYLGVIRREPQASKITPNTTLGRFLHLQQELLDSFLAIALPRVQSFQLIQAPSWSPYS